VSPGSDPPSAEELEQLEELGDDAIVAQQLGAHAPKPRVQVVEEARSIVISEHPPGRATPAPEAQAPAGDKAPKKKRSERTEKTVVIRDRRQIDDLRRHIAKVSSSAPPPPSQGILLWVIVGVAAFLLGGVVALFATREEAPAQVAPTPSAQATVGLVGSASAEPPPVSIDALPIEKK
jgi:hypothetical protein